ncbi:hypothetical protein SI65_09255 [Aspergillus cristatus]|uniref:Myb-like DNA-binding domain-containing protein n=1 Tax=Aspergillus cristatus TaxID=573508 RepID=A0A1E3B313_ASPCR|nr:hypothetical protein SI65_09255 [Aspergillus cristatus]
MSRISNDDQFQFLISCIRHSNNGKIDYTEVAKECSIVSRGAAVKRYSRLMKAHGINTGGDINTTTSTSTPTGSTNTTPKKPKTNGKRKTTADSETETESNGKAKASKRGKKDRAVESAEKVVKKAGLDTVKEDEDAEEKIQGETEDSE